MTRISILFPILVLTVCQACCVSSCGQEPADSTVQMLDDSDRTLGRGIVVLVNDNLRVKDGRQGLVATALHVVRELDPHQISVKYRDGRIARRCSVQSCDPVRDTAIPWVWVPDSTAAVDVAGELEADSYTWDLPAGAQTAPLVRTFIFSEIVATPGDSGSGVFDPDGKLVGLVLSGWRRIDPQTGEASDIPLIRACGPQAIRDLVESCTKCRVETAGDPDYQTAWQAAKQDGKPLVVLIASASCQPCIIEKARIKSIDTSSVHFAVVDIQRQAELARRITSRSATPQLVVFTKSGDKWKRKVYPGLQSTESLRKIFGSTADRERGCN